MKNNIIAIVLFTGLITTVLFAKINKSEDCCVEQLECCEKVEACCK